MNMFQLCEEFTTTVSNNIIRGLEPSNAVSRAKIMELSVSSSRYHYMDNLRALAMMLGIFYHAALAYSPFMHELWLSADAEDSVVLDCLAWFMHLFRMPLFFLISGFFAHYLIEKHGVSGFLKNRLHRIVLPFIVFLPLTLLAILGVAFYASISLEIHTVLLDFVVQTVSQWPNHSSEEAYFSTSHLWFLYSLMWFCGLTALLYKMVPHFVSCYRLVKSPWFLLGVLPVLLVPSLVGRIVPLPAPGRLTPEWWSFGFFGVFFFLGWLYYKNISWLSQIAKYWLLMTIVAVLSYIVYYRLIPNNASLSDTLFDIADARPVSLEGLIGAFSAAFVSVYLTFLCLLLGYKYLNRESSFLRYVADSSYWIYIIHLPVLIFIQMFLLKLEWPVMLKFAIGSIGTIAVGIATYAVMVRRTPIGWLLNGRKLGR